MTQVIAVKSFANLITKDQSYEMVREIGHNYIVLDNDGDETGFSKEWFKEPEVFNPHQFAMSIVRLMLFPKCDNFTEKDIVRAKASATLVSEMCKHNCESESEINTVEQIAQAIDGITLSDL